MELSSSPEAGISMPISVSYRPVHESFKQKIQEAHAGSGGGNVNFQQDSMIKTLEPSEKPVVRFRECLKNHAASMGGHAVDGCGDFMPSGEEGSLEALKCAACGCHRNFHRREVDGEPPCYCFSSPRDGKRLAHLALPAPPLPQKPMMVRPSAQMIMALPSGHAQDSDDQDLHTGGSYMPHLAVPYHHLPSMALVPKLTKRFRTKFSTEQKDKMHAFAERLGWRIQKHDEAAVQQFCTDVGVKRHVLKVWMHNNKHTFAKKLPLRFPETFDPVPDSVA